MLLGFVAHILAVADGGSPRDCFPQIPSDLEFQRWQPELDPLPGGNGLDSVCVWYTVSEWSQVRDDQPRRRQEKPRGS